MHSIRRRLLLPTKSSNRLTCYLFFTRIAGGDLFFLQRGRGVVEAALE